MRRARPSRLAWLLAGVLAAATALVGLSAGPAAAALCSSGGVNVVVDFNGLGKGVQKSCDPDGAGRTGDRVFPAAGFALTYAQRQPGFVCRVNGSPNSDPCVNTAPSDAYWGLFWSDGRSGKWSYASSGVGGLKVPDGGFMAFSWQGSESKDPPSAAPVNHPVASPAPSPSRGPSEAPSKHPSKDPSGGPSGGPSKAPAHQSTGTPAGASGPAGDTAAHQSGATRAASTAPSGGAARAQRSGAGSRERGKAQVQKRPKASATASPTTSQTLDPTDEAAPDAVAQQQPGSAFRSPEDRDGLPTWVPVAVIAVLAAAAAGAVLWRRRGASG